MAAVRYARERAALVAAGRRLSGGGLSPGTSGNLSLRVGDVVLVTPTGAELASLSPEMVTAVDAGDGRVVHGTLEPTSELALHLAVHGTAAGTAVAHAHPPASTAVGLVLDELPPVHYNTVLLGGPVRVAGYATFGSAALAEVVAAALDRRYAALMRHHGAVAVGDTIEQACDRLELLEWLAEVYLRAATLGTPRVLDEAELDAARAEFEGRRYGTPRRLP